MGGGVDELGGGEAGGADEGVGFGGGGGESGDVDSGGLQESEFVISEVSLCSAEQKEGRPESRKERLACMSRIRPCRARCAWWTLYSKRRDWETRNSSERMSSGVFLTQEAKVSIETGQFSVFVARKRQVSLHEGVTSVK